MDESLDISSGEMKSFPFKPSHREDGIDLDDSTRADISHVLCPDMGEPFGLFQSQGDGVYIVSDEHPILTDHFDIVPGVVGVSLLRTHFDLGNDVFMSGVKISFKEPLRSGYMVQCVQTDRGYRLVDANDVHKIFVSLDVSSRDVEFTLDTSLPDERTSLAHRDEVLSFMPHGDGFMFIDSAHAYSRGSAAVSQVPFSLPHSNEILSCGEIPASLLIEIAAQGALVGILSLPEYKDWSVLFSGANVSFADTLNNLSPGGRLMVYSERRRQRDTRGSVMLQSRTDVYFVCEEEGDDFGKHIPLLTGDFSCVIFPR